MAQKRILVVEDNAPIRRGIVDALAFAGYETLEAKDGREGIKKALESEYDLLLLDLVLPDGDGFEILRQLRKQEASLPVIILTARGEEADRVRGLRMGADDYVVKPFSVKELLARIEAVLRRSPERPDHVSDIRFQGGSINCERLEIRFDNGDTAAISQREIELLRYLAGKSGKVVSRDEIMKQVWRLNPDAVAETRTIDMHIARLREKLRDDSAHPRIIVTVRGKGYMFCQQEDEK